MEGVPDDMWSPYKSLHRLIEYTLANPSEAPLDILESTLKKYKQTFACLLKNRPKNEHLREQLRNYDSHKIPISGSNRAIALSKDLVDECIIISDMFNLDEYLALELVCTAQYQMHQHSGLPRGLVAVLLYYDGRKAIATCLRDLFQVTSGVSWISDLPKDLVNIVSSFTQNLVESTNILQRILDLLEVELDLPNEIVLLTKNRALGQSKHQNQVIQLFEEIRLALATALFNWSAQRSLPSFIVIRLIKSLCNYKSSSASGPIDDIMITLLMAVLYSYDTSVLQKVEDDRLIHNINIIKDNEFAQVVLNTLLRDVTKVQNEGVVSIVKYSFGLSLASLRHATQYLDATIYKVVKYDDQLVDEAINSGLFKYMYYFILDKDLIYSNEFFYRRMHALYTDFIDFMHSKVTELRGKADETTKTVMNFTNAGLEPPSNLNRSFEMLLLCIGKLYREDRLQLSLCMEYWGSYELSLEKTTNRSVSLFKFIRLAGELLPTTLFVAYLKMLAGISSCEKAARNTFNFLKQPTNAGGNGTMSWDHFFTSLNRYYTNLRQETGAASGNYYRYRTLNRPINPNEVEGLSAVLEIIQAVAEYDEVARIAFCEHPNWNALCALIGLLSCSVPLNLKADILGTLSALAKSKETSFVIWNNLEASQIINTIPNANMHNACNLAAEIELNESRIEKYPLTKGILDLLYSLILSGVPKNLGFGPRKPGLYPYLRFVLNDIFLKFYSKNYEDPVEKWIIGAKCLKIFYYLLDTYEVLPQDFHEEPNSNSPPGFYIMLQLQNKTTAIQLILTMIDEFHVHIMDYKSFRSKTDLDECALYCLKILRYGIIHQDIFFEAHSIASGNTLLCGLKKILLDVNPRTKLPDYILITTSFVMYSHWLPHHSLEAVKILHSMCQQIRISTQILQVITQNENMQKELLQGFVECLDCEYIPIAKSAQNNKKGDLEENESSNIEIQTKEVIIQLIKDNLHYPPPNLSFYLLGITYKQNYTCSNHPKCVFEWKLNCTKSVVTLLDNHLDMKKTMSESNIQIERLMEKLLSLVFLLCSNSKTSDSILKYLRTRNDFLCRHLKTFSTMQMQMQNVTIMNQLSYLLKCIAIELKLTGSNSTQINRFEDILKFFFGEPPKDNINELNIEELDVRSINEQSDVVFDDIFECSTSFKRLNSLCGFLKYVDFKINELPLPKWNFFDYTRINGILRECEIKDSHENGGKLIDIKKLHTILNNELKSVQNTIAIGQKKSIMEELESVLLYAIKMNEQSRKSNAKITFMESWGQVTEILFSFARDSPLISNLEQDLIMEVLQKILDKFSLNQLLPEEAVLLSGTVLLLLINLRNCLSKARNFDLSLNATTPDIRSYTLNLKHILSSIVEWITNSGTTSQKLRVNLYASLLNILNMLQDQNLLINTPYGSSVINCSLRLGKSMEDCPMPLQTLINTLTLFGEKLMALICHDCLCGHDICKILAFACVNILIQIDIPSTFLTFISNRGYLIDIINSLEKSNDDLCRILNNTPDNMKCLYIYESKMSMLLCMANNSVGAEILLSNRILEILSGMSVFSMHPDVRGNEFQRGYDTCSFVYSIDARFRQILFPALHLCHCLLVTLGTENYSATSQIIHFLLSHCDMVEVVLRAANPLSDLGLLEETSLITGLIARTFLQDPTNTDVRKQYDSKLIDVYKIQGLMLTILSRFMLREYNLREKQRSINIFYESTDENISLHNKLCLEITANVVLFCRKLLMGYSDIKSQRLVFTPYISDITQSKENNSAGPQKCLNLGVLVKHIKGLIEYYNAQKNVMENLTRQNSTLNSMVVNALDHQKYLTSIKELNSKENDLSLCTFIAQHLIYLLWTHVDTYMKMFDYDNLENSRLVSLCLSDPNKKIKVTIGDISAMKKDLIATLTETFSKQMCLMSESVNKPNDNMFNQALLRRIKSLIQCSPID